MKHAIIMALLLNATAAFAGADSKANCSANMQNPEAVAQALKRANEVSPQSASRTQEGSRTNSPKSVN